MPNVINDHQNLLGQGVVPILRRSGEGCHRPQLAMERRCALALQLLHSKYLIVVLNASNVGIWLMVIVSCTN